MAVGVCAVVVVVVVVVGRVYVGFVGLVGGWFVVVVVVNSVVETLLYDEDGISGVVGLVGVIGVVLASPVNERKVYYYVKNNSRVD